MKTAYSRIELPAKRSILKVVDFVGEMAGRAERLHSGFHVELPIYRLLPTPTLALGLNAVYGRMMRHSLGKRTVDMELCDLCGACVEACPVSAVSVEDAPVFSRECIGCWGCFNTCPRAAIRSTLASSSSYYSGITDRERKLREAGLYD